MNRALAMALTLGAVLATLAGCALLGERVVAYPDGCASLGFSERRCAGIVDAARRDARGTPIAVALEGPEDGSATLGGHQVARVVFTYADGSTEVTPVSCIGIPNGPDDAVCTEPSIGLRDTVDHDVPCSGEPPAGCPTQIVPDAAAVAQSRPLRRATFDVPIAGIGHVEVPVGGVRLPNGYVTTVDARILNDTPTDFWIRDYVTLDLRPDDPSRPAFGNVYQRPLVEGTEDATLWLVFDVTEASPGAVLHLADIVVE